MSANTTYRRLNFAGFSFAVAGLGAFLGAFLFPSSALWSFLVSGLLWIGALLFWLASSVMENDQLRGEFRAARGAMDYYIGAEIDHLTHPAREGWVTLTQEDTALLQKIVSRFEDSCRERADAEHRNGAGGDE